VALAVLLALVLAAEDAALDQRNGKWRYREFLQVMSLITADIHA